MVKQLCLMHLDNNNVKCVVLIGALNGYHILLIAYADVRYEYSFTP